MERVFVAITNIKHGSGEVDEDGLPVFVYVSAGDKIRESEFPGPVDDEGTPELLTSLIASGSVAEYKEVLYVEDTAKVEALTEENAALLDENAALQAKIAELMAAQTPQQ